MRGLLATSLLLLATVGASAQSALVVSPGTLFCPTDTEVSIRNASSQSVVLDSLAIRFDGPRAYYTVLMRPPVEDMGLYFNTTGAMNE